MKMKETKIKTNYAQTNLDKVEVEKLTKPYLVHSKERRALMLSNEPEELILPIQVFGKLDLDDYRIQFNQSHYRVSAIKKEQRRKRLLSTRKEPCLLPNAFGSKFKGIHLIVSNHLVFIKTMDEKAPNYIESTLQISGLSDSMTNRELGSVLQSLQRLISTGSYQYDSLLKESLDCCYDEIIKQSEQNPMGRLPLFYSITIIDHESTTVELELEEPSLERDTVQRNDNDQILPNPPIPKDEAMHLSIVRAEERKREMTNFDLSKDEDWSDLVEEDIHNQDETPIA